MESSSNTSSYPESKQSKCEISSFGSRKESDLVMNDSGNENTPSFVNAQTQPEFASVPQNQKQLEQKILSEADMQIDTPNLQKISNSAYNINDSLKPKSTACDSSNPCKKTSYLIINSKKCLNFLEQEAKSEDLGQNKILNNDLYSIKPSDCKFRPLPSTEFTNHLGKDQTSNFTIDSDKFSYPSDNSDFLHSNSYDETKKQKNPATNNFCSKHFLFKNDKNLLKEKTDQKPCMQNNASKNINVNFNFFFPNLDDESNFNDNFASSSHSLFDDLIVKLSKDNQHREFPSDNNSNNTNNFWNLFNVNGSYPFQENEFSQDSL